MLQWQEKEGSDEVGTCTDEHANAPADIRGCAAFRRWCQHTVQSHPAPDFSTALRASTARRAVSWGAKLEERRTPSMF